MTENEEEETLNLVETLTCTLNCKECEKSLEQCIKDTRISVNLLMRDFLIKYKEMKLEKEEMDSMVS